MYGIKKVVFIIFSKSASKPLQNMWHVFLHLSVRESRSFKRFQHMTSWRSQSEISAQTFYSRIMQWSFMSNFFLNLLNSSSVCRLWREPLQKFATGSLICSNSLDEWCGHSGVKHLQRFFCFGFISATDVQWKFLVQPFYHHLSDYRFDMDLIIDI